MKNDFKINNKAEDTAELSLYGIIGDYWEDLDAKDIVQAIKKISKQKIIVNIFSSGGSVFSGLAIYNALKEHSADITIKIDSLAASIASVIAMAGTVIMPENAFMMIHNPWSMAYGEESDMLKMAEVLAKIKTSLIGVYAGKTGKTYNEISALMDFETWFTAKEAVSEGFADSIIDCVEPKDFKSSEIFNHCRNIPPEVKTMIDKKTLTKPAQNGAEHKSDIGEKTMLTIETLAKDAPDLLAKIKKDSKDVGYDEGFVAGTEQERTRVSELLKIEDADDTTRAQAIIDGLSVDASFKLFFEAEKQKKQTNLEELEKSAEESVGQSGKEKNNDGKKTFMQAVDEFQTEKKCTRTEALKAVASANPELHSEFLGGK